MRLESKSDYHKSIIHLWGTVKSTARGIFKLTIKYDKPLNVDLEIYAKILKGKKPSIIVNVGKEQFFDIITHWKV